VINRNGRPIPVPRIVGPIRRRQPVKLRDLKVLRANTGRKIKATVPGPFTMGRQAQDDYYRDEEAVAMAYAEAVNAEIKDLCAAGADVVQFAELPSKTIVLGVIDLGDMTVEVPQIVAERIRRALQVVPAERIVVAPDCGMKYLPRAITFAKMKAMADGAALLRRELGAN
jgi:methionine synthase II (cobalamin-independent)